MLPTAYGMWERYAVDSNFTSHTHPDINMGASPTSDQRGFESVIRRLRADLPSRAAPQHASDTTVRDIAAGAFHTCVLFDVGTVRCWGEDSFGQLGDGHVGMIGDDELPAAENVVDVGGLVTQIVAGLSHTYALLDDGRVRCWGRGAFGRLGYGTTTTIGYDEAPATAGDVPLF